MRLGDSIIVTPLDNPAQYDPDWRNSIAMGLMESGAYVDPAYAQYTRDPWIRKQIAFLKAVEQGRPLTKEQLQFRLANIWFQENNVTGARFRLEPLLLTPVSYEVIALDILGDNGCDDLLAIEAYEKLYFNIRDNAGRLSRSCQLRQYFAMPSGIPNHDTPPEQQWRLIAALCGYDVLMAVWMWRDAHGLINYSQEYMLDEMWRVSQSKLFVSMFADRVGHESMAKLLASISAQQKMIQDGKKAGTSTDEEMVRAMQGILGLMSPKMVGAIAADVDRAKIAEASAARLRTESAVDAVDIGEVGQNGVKFLGG